MYKDTDVQWNGNTEYARVWTVVSDPLEIGEGVDRLSVDIKSSDAGLLDDFAEFRNQMAVVQKKRLKRKWTRKAMAEDRLAISCDALRHQLSAMFAEVGPLPKAEDTEAMLKYARRVHAWEEKKSK